LSQAAAPAKSPPPQATATSSQPQYNLAAKLTVTRQTHFNVISCPMAKKLTWQSLPRARIPPRQPVKREAEEDWGKERWQQQSK
jgi:hypothetical protein